MLTLFSKHTRNHNMLERNRERYKEFFCCHVPGCDYESPRSRNVTAHLKQKHPSMGNCTECPRGIREGSIEEHFKIFHSKDETSPQQHSTCSHYDGIYKSHQWNPPSRSFENKEKIKINEPFIKTETD